MAKKAAPKKIQRKKSGEGKIARKSSRPPATAANAVMPRAPTMTGGSPAVLDRLYSVVESRRGADPEISHSARLLARGTAKIAQKFGEEAVECLIEAVGRNPDALVAESADVLYHMLVMWVDAGVSPGDVWAELQRREGVSGVAEKAARVSGLAASYNARTTKIP